jgi:hypothetical protein
MAMRWIKCSERLPTAADGDGTGVFIVRSVVNGVLLFDLACDELGDVEEYDEWLAGACEREGEVLRLDSAGRDVTHLPGLWDESDEFKKNDSEQERSE